MKIIKNFKKFVNYVQRGGEYYLTINPNYQHDYLKDKTIFITGGTSGIGLSIARVCSSNGANVIICGRNINKLNEISKELNCKYIEWDVADVNVLGSKIEKLKSITNNKLDCFVNCAGIYKDIRYNSCSIDDWDSIINTNLKGPYFLTNKIVTDFFEKRNKGNIVFIASNRGVFGDDGPYGISKAALINYGRGLANKLLNKGIRVNIVNPGMTASNINGIKDSDNLYRSFLKGKRVIASNEIANTVLFLLSDSSSSMTGQVINCDNGETVL